MSQALPLAEAPDALALWKERGLDAPFMVVTGTIGEEHAVEVLKAGAHDFFLKYGVISKPLDLATAYDSSFIESVPLADRKP